MALHIIHSNLVTSTPPCAGTLPQHDDVLFIGDAAYLLRNTTAALTELGLNAAQNIYVLEEDARARGVDGLERNSVKSINYKDFVELTIKHKHIQTWY